MSKMPQTWTDFQRLPSQCPPQEGSWREIKGRIYLGSKSKETSAEESHNQQQKKNPNNNSFEALNCLPEAKEVENLHKAVGKDPNNQKEDHPSQEYQTPTNQEREEDTVMEMDEQDLAEIDLDRLEEALNKKDIQTLPEDQLRKVHKLFLDSSVGAISKLGININPNQYPRKHPKENKRQGKKSAHQLIKEARKYMINSGQIQRLLESSFSHPSNC